MRVGRLALLLAIIAAVMAVLAWAAAPPERTMRVLAEAVAVLSAGAVPVVLFARRKAVVFEPEGLRLVEWRYDVRVPWDQIAGARILEIEDTLLVALTLRDPVKLAPIPRARHADPSATQRRLARAMRLCRATFGCDLTLGPAAHGLDPILFLRAIETYVADPAARPRLAPLGALASGDRPLP